MIDDDYEGASGPVRQFLGGIRARQHADNDPINSSSAPAPVNGGLKFLRDTTREVQGFAADAAAAQNAPYGSIASRNDPNQYGSVASRSYGGLFGPTGSANPQYRADQANTAHEAQQRDAVAGTQASAALQGQFTAAYLQPLLAKFAQGMPRRSPSIDPAQTLQDETENSDGK